jgi:hypothetical protein
LDDDDAHVAVIIIDDAFCCGVDDTLTEEFVDDA